MNQNYSWPYESNSTDFSLSWFVIENIINLEEFIKENARILQKSVYYFHYFPARSALVEAHNGIPFGGLIINKFYYDIMFKLRLYCVILVLIKLMKFITIWKSQLIALVRLNYLIFSSIF